ncbi:MAG: choice-of-anchor B family protein [Saprospiraceae bacterium]
MKVILLSSIFCLFSILSSHAQFQANSLANWQDDDLVPTNAYNSRYNDVWGYAKDGREYAIIGSTRAIHIIDVTDPANIEEVQRVAGHAGGSFLIHRDMKVYRDYLYCVADEGSSALQIIDLSMLPDTAVQVYDSNEFVVTSHNMFIDSSQARLYIVGKGSTTTALDISNPAAPVLLANYPKPGFPLPYVHDAYIENNIGYMNCANQGLWVVDFTDPDNPVALGSMDGYPEEGYNHSGWMAEDGDHYFMCDETHGSAMKVVDVSDPSEMNVVKLFSPGYRDNEIPHNVIVKDGLLYVSHYYDGMQVFDVSNPLNPIRVAEYDTYPDADAAWYAGNWGIYPLLPSGNILLSDMQYGLFVIEKLPATITQYLDVNESEFEICTGETVEFEMTVGSGFADTGVSLSANTNNLNATVEFVPSATAMPGDVVAVFITNISGGSGISEELTILANDGINNQTASIYILANDAPPAVSGNVAPMLNATVPVGNIYFEWAGVPEANSYLLEIATDENNFENTIVFDEETSANLYTMNASLAAGTLYFWRVTTKNICGENIGSIFKFNTEPINSTNELNGNKLTIYPNPAADYLMINFAKEINTKADLEIYSTTGQLIYNSVIFAGQNNFKLNTAGFLNGIYLIKINTPENTYTQRFLVENNF